MWIVLPMLALSLVLVAWGFLSFVFSSVLATQDSPAASAVMTLNIVNIVLGFLGILSLCRLVAK